MRRIKWIIHNRKEILFADMSAANSDSDVEAITNEINNILVRHPKGTILFIVDMRNAFISPCAMKFYQKGAKVANKNCKAWAVFGLDKLMLILMDEMAKKLHLNTGVFKTEKESKQWIVTK